jgi:hypothetical protein
MEMAQKIWTKKYGLSITAYKNLNTVILENKYTPINLSIVDTTKTSKALISHQAIALVSLVIAVAACARTSQNPRKLSCGAKRRNLVSGFYVLIQLAIAIIPSQ